MTTAASREPASATYQRFRLWCGIWGIGSVLGFLWMGLLLGLPGGLGRMLGGLPPEVGGAVAAGILGLVVTALQLFPDLAARRVERAFGQATKSTLDVYLLRSTEWVVGLIVAGVVVGLSVRVGGDLWWLILGPMLLVLAFSHVVVPFPPAPAAPGPQASWWDRVVGELRKVDLPVPSVRWYDHGERSLAGGWNGAGPLRRLFVAKTLHDLPPTTAAALLAREIGHLRLGHRRVTTLLTLGSVVIGVLLSAGVSAWLEVTTAPGVVAIVATVMSTWCWLCILGPFPAIGRRQVLAADRFVADSLGKDAARSMLDALSHHNLPDHDLPPAKAFVFHPIPPMQARRQALEEGSS